MNKTKEIEEELRRTLPMIARRCGVKEDDVVEVLKTMIG